MKDADKDVLGRLVETMAVHDAMFPCGRVVEGGAGGFMVPARLPGSVAEASLVKLQEAVSRGTRMQFIIDIYAEYVPPAIIAQFLGAFGRSSEGIFRNLVFHTCWTRGVSFEAAGRECLIRLGENLVSQEGAEASTEFRRTVEINIGGPGKDDVFKVGFDIKEKVEQLLEERYPGLLFDASLNPTYKSGPGAWQDSLDALQRDLLEKVTKLRRARGLKFYLRSGVNGHATFLRQRRMPIFVGPRASVFHVSVRGHAYEEDAHLHLMSALFSRAHTRSFTIVLLVRLFPESLSSPERPCPVSGLH